MLRTAKSLDGLVESINALKKVHRFAALVTDEKLQELLSKSSDQKLAKRASIVGSHASPDYARALLAATIREIQKISDLADVETDFPEMVPPTEEAPAEGGEEAPVVSEEAPAAVPAEALLAEPEVEVAVEGEGVELVHAEDSKLYMVLPNSTVLKLSDASPEEAKVAMALLKQAKSTSNPSQPIPAVQR
jgi:hypothetical protein